MGMVHYNLGATAGSRLVQLLIAAALQSQQQPILSMSIGFVFLQFITHPTSCRVLSGFLVTVVCHLSHVLLHCSMTKDFGLEHVAVIQKCRRRSLL